MKDCMICELDAWRASGACFFKILLLSGEEKEIFLCENCATQIYKKLLDHKSHGFEMRSSDEILEHYKKGR